MGLWEELFGAVTRPETPLHVGEVMVLWSCMAAMDEGRALILMMLNQTSDAELKRFMEHYVKDLDEPQQRRLGDFLRNEGIPHPPVTPDRPKSNERDVPLGVKCTDDEIANMLAVKIIGALQMCQSGLLQALRPDVGAMLLAFHTELLRHGLMLQQIMRKRGWLKMPPLWYPSRATN